MDISKEKIIHIFQEGLDNEIITKDEFIAMNPTDMGPAKFYELFKIHKPHIPGEAPPERPIISASGSVTDNIALFVETHLKKPRKQTSNISSRHTRLSQSYRGYK